MDIAQIRIQKTKDKEVFFEEAIKPNQKLFLNGIQNVDDIPNLSGNLLKKNEFLPVCVNVCGGEDVKVDITDIIKKEMNGNANYQTTITLEIEIED